jgi:transposase
MFTVADVARLYDLDYGVVYKIDHEVLLRLIQKREIPDPINIAVDEKSFRKRHNYVTIVTDTDTSDVIWVSKGNTQESLDEFFKAIGPERCQKIKTVSKDLHKAYIASCLKYIPHATEVADPFHVVKRLNQAIDECRKELSVGSRLKVNKRKTIDNMQWVLRYKQENMKAGHLESLEELEKINKPLFKAYLHKETFFDFFEFKPSEISEAKNFLIKWTMDAVKIGLNGLYEFAKYIMTHQRVLLNIVRTQRNSAISEGINRKISVIKNMAYGYRNIQYFMLKILQRCGVLGSLWEPAP